MDPVTLMASATASYNAVKRAIAAGQELESMIGSLSKWMSCLSDLDQAEREAKNPPIFKKLFSGKSIEQEALEIFAAKQKAQQQRDELRQFIGLTLGQSKWDELVATEARIRKQRQETMYAQRERRRKFVEIAAWTVMIGAGLAVLTTFVRRSKRQFRHKRTIPRRRCSSSAANGSRVSICVSGRWISRHHPTSMTCSKP